MNQRNRRIAPLAASFTTTVALLGACASHQQVAESSPAPIENGVSAWWVPQTVPSFTTLDDSTVYAMVHDQNKDLVVCEQYTDAGQMTWLITLPCFPAFNVPLEVGEKSVQAWVIEQPHQQPAHMQLGQGEVIILSRVGNELTATFNLEAVGRSQTAGVISQPTITFHRKVSCARYEPYTPQPSEVTARSGVSDQ